MSEKHIYKGLTPFTLGLLPSRRRPIVDGSGAISMGAPTRSGKIIFTNGTFEVNEQTAASYTQPNGKPFTVATLVKELERHPTFGSKYKKVFDSTKEPTKEQVKFSEAADEANASRGVGVTQGPRAKKN